MNKAQSLGLIFATLGLVLFGFSNCGKPGDLSSNGTDSGNPITYGDDLFADELSAAVCAKVAQCFPPGPSDCGAQVPTLTNLISPLGLNPATYESLSLVQAAINSHTLNEDAPQRELCTDQLRHLACSDSAVMAAYDPANPSDLSNLDYLLIAAPTCGRVVSSK